MFMKPWKYENVLYENYFWNYAKQTSYYNFIKNAQQSYSNESKEKDRVGLENLLKLANNIANSDNNYKTVVLKKHKKNIQSIELKALKNIGGDLLETLLPSPIKTSHRR